MSDGRQKGEADLADLIETYLWDACNGPDAIALESIRESALTDWKQQVRNLLERLAINQYHNSDGHVRKLNETQPTWDPYP